MSSTFDRIRPEHGVHALGTFCFGLGTVHLLTEGTGFGTGLEAFVVGSISAFVVFTGRELRDRSISASGRWRVVRLGVGVAGSFALLAVAIWSIWLLEGDPTEFSFLLSFITALGAMVGVRGGLYAVESDERLEEAEDLSKLLTINHRVLRHDLRNELSVALGYLDNIETSDTPTETAEEARMIRKHLERILETTDRTRRVVSIWNADRRTAFDLTSLIEERVDRLRGVHPDVDISTRFTADCRVEAHPALPTAVEEALRNAVEHTPDDASITVTVRADRAGSAVVEVADTGSGISKFDVDAIESEGETPLVHTQGLGLWMIYWTLETSDGDLELAENRPTGTVVRMTLPATCRLGCEESGTPR
ncbi:sensor histidine kinase [Halorubrum rubrum]|uniref:histidine kinase n=1 Tax=Halorubrum rubrum TaxID=1126240 RepID=A0ABD5QZ03_9EURY|nr:HAMP domain-containing sensor histidine kinase [Halorubrum rubrum]